MIDGMLAVILKEIGVGILLKTTVVMVLAAGATCLLGRASAALRYSIWGAAFVLLLLLPFASQLVPTQIVLYSEGPAMVADAVDEGTGPVNRNPGGSGNGGSFSGTTAAGAGSGAKPEPATVGSVTDNAVRSVAVPAGDGGSRSAGLTKPGRIDS